MNPTVRWILFVVGLLVSNLLAMGYLVLASSTSRADVIPNYYDKAAHFDREIDQATANRALGWHIDVRRGLEIVVRDVRGEALRGARVLVTATPRATGKTTTLQLVERDDRYAVPHPATGVEDLEITVERGGERFTARATLE